jgi:hypothetical protein
LCRSGYLTIGASLPVGIRVLSGRSEMVNG